MNISDVKVGDRIEVLKDFAHGTREMEGKVLTVTKVNPDIGTFDTDASAHFVTTGSGSWSWGWNLSLGLRNEDFRFLARPRLRWEQVSELLDEQREARRGNW